jgi:hypothetical protein
MRAHFGASGSRSSSVFVQHSFKGVLIAGLGISEFFEPIAAVEGAARNVRKLTRLADGPASVIDQNADQKPAQIG